MYEFVLKEKAEIHLPPSAQHPVISEIIEGYTAGIDWEILFDAEENTVVIGSSALPETADEDFVLNINENGMAIAGKDHASTLRGLFDFLERLQATDPREYSCNKALYKEKAKITFRSVHLCIFPETSFRFMRKAIRAIAVSKYTHIILEFWGVLKYDCFGYLCWNEGLTKDEVRELVAEARALGLEVIPFFNHLGHASLSRGMSGKHVVLDQAPEYGYLFFPDSHGWVWNFLRKDVKGLLSEVRRELCELCGEGSYFHIGCDEAFILGYGQNYAKEIAEYINEIEEDLRAEGRRPMIWGDMLLSKAFLPEGTGGYMCNSSKEIAETLLDSINKNVIIADWQYFVKGETWKTSVIFKERGFEVICCPWSDRETLKPAVDTVTENGLYGIMKTTWHTLQKEELGPLVQLGLSAVKGEHDDSWHALYYGADNAAGIIRGVSPSRGDYVSSGWRKDQLELTDY